MTRSLKTLAKQSEPFKLKIKVQERLPNFIQAPCELNCEIQVKKETRYYHLSLETKGCIHVTCQRCLHDFDYYFDQKNEIAICFDDEAAEQMMSMMECIVHPDDELDLISIVTDELHLYCPEKHVNTNDCDVTTQALIV